MSYQRPRFARALLWGLANGVGFAIAEGLFNTTSGLDAWGFVIVMRVGATMLHCFTGALMGVAWHYALVERHPFRAVGLFIGSVAVHGAWNALAAGVALFSLAGLEEGLATADLGPAGVASAVSLGLLVLTGAGMSLGLAGLTVQHRLNHGKKTFSRTSLACSIVLAPARRSSLTSRSWAVWKNRSIRPFAWGL